MNERVEALAGQAFQFAADNADETGKGQLGVFAEKFAELIVLECADWLSHREFASPEALKHHFGVK